MKREITNKLCYYGADRGENTCAVSIQDKIKGLGAAHTETETRNCPIYLHLTHINRRKHQLYWHLKIEITALPE